MKVVFLVPYPEKIAPGQRFRYEQYQDKLYQIGAEYRTHSFLSMNAWKVLHQPGHFPQKAISILLGFWKRFILLFSLIQYDYVFIFREASHIGPPVFEWIIAKVLRKKIIYDFDDAIWLPNYSSHNASFHKLKYYQKVNSIMKWAYKISAGNAYLANYARQFNNRVIVLPTTIDTENHHNQIKEHDDTKKPVIGWTGTLTTSKYIGDIVGALQRLEQEYDFEFCVISNEAPDYNLKSLVFKRWKKETEIEDLLRFDIGIMPLVDDKWAKGKCGFKALQYMALGIPPVVSPVGVNTDIVQDGENGRICQTEDDWYNALSQLLRHPELRKELGSKAHQTVLNHYSVIANTEKFLNLFS